MRRPIRSTTWPRFCSPPSCLIVLVESRAVVVNTTSSSQKLLGKVTIDDLENTHRRRPSTAYALTKLGIILFTKELHRRYHAAGLSAVAFHPGYVDSNFGPASGSRLLAFMRPPAHDAIRGDRRSGSRPAGMAGLKHARYRLEIRRILLAAQDSQTEPCGAQHRARPPAVGSQSRPDIHLTARCRRGSRTHDRSGLCRRGIVRPAPARRSSCTGGNQSSRP